MFCIGQLNHQFHRIFLASFAEQFGVSRLDADVSQQSMGETLDRLEATLFVRQNLHVALIFGVFRFLILVPHSQPFTWCQIDSRLTDLGRS